MWRWDESVRQLHPENNGPVRMNGERDLQRLLAGLSPRLRPGTYVFCSIPGAGYGEHAELEPLACFRESEGLSLLIPEERAAARGLVCSAAFRGITLDVHSSLEAVGLNAAVASLLKDHGLCANLIAGCFHDHLFVPAGAAEQALTLLQELAGRASASGPGK